MSLHDLPVLTRLGEDLRRAAEREIGRPPRWRRPVALAVPALAAAALLAVLVLPGGSGPGAAERAYAAVTPGDEILHVVQEADHGAMAARMELWTDGDTTRLVSDGPGVFAAETVFDGDQVTTYNVFRDELGSFPATRNSLLVSVLDRFEAFAQRAERGELGSPREDHFDGRPVVRFDRRLARGPATESWFFAADTFVPVATRITAPGGYNQTTRFLVWERVPYDDQLLEMSPHPGAERTDGGVVLVP
jgi:putative intracellular protease/amidase